MIARHQYHRHAVVSHVEQWFEGFCHEPGPDLTAVEQIAAVNDEVYLASQSRFKSDPRIDEKIWPTTPFLNPRPRRQIETEMGIG
jgi:hypothetical protein